MYIVEADGQQLIDIDETVFQENSLAQAYIFYDLHEAERYCQWIRSISDPWNIEAYELPMDLQMRRLKQPMLRL